VRHGVLDPALRFPLRLGDLTLDAVEHATNFLSRACLPRRRSYRGRRREGSAGLVQLLDRDGATGGSLVRDVAEVLGGCV
jgi:hypothetical protein